MKLSPLENRLYKVLVYVRDRYGIVDDNVVHAAILGVEQHKKVRLPPINKEQRRKDGDL